MFVNKFDKLVLRLLYNSRFHDERLDRLERVLNLPKLSDEELMKIVVQKEREELMERLKKDVEKK